MSNAAVLTIEEDGSSSATLTLDESLYCAEAVRRATYWFTDRCFVSLSESNGVIAVRLRSKGKTLDLRQVASQLQDSILDAQLRVEIGHETAQIRDLIVAKAFAEGDLLEDDPVGDWRDPLIAKQSNKQ